MLQWPFLEAAPMNNGAAWCGLPFPGREVKCGWCPLCSKPSQESVSLSFFFFEGVSLVGLRLDLSHDCFAFCYELPSGSIWNQEGKRKVFLIIRASTTNPIIASTCPPWHTLWPSGESGGAIVWLCSGNRELTHLSSHDKQR